MGKTLALNSTHMCFLFFVLVRAQQYLIFTCLIQYINCHLPYEWDSPREALLDFQ